MLDDTERIKGLIAMAATAFLWSIAGLFIKMIDWHPLVIAGARSFISSLVILVYLRKPTFHWSFPQIAAAVANAVTMLLFVAANKTTTAANAIVLQYVMPVFTAIISVWLLKERIRREQWMVMILVMVGIWIMFLDKLNGGRMLGNILALVSGLTFSFYFVFMRMQKNSSPLESVLLSHWITAVAGLSMIFFAPVPPITMSALIAISVLGIIQVGFSAVLFCWAIKRISALSANLVAVIEPVFNPIWVFLVIGESPGVNALIGGSIIIGSVTASSVLRPQRNLKKT
jgi:drug/metabolite transporter (DMT)-like permease